MNPSTPVIWCKKLGKFPVGEKKKKKSITDDHIFNHIYKKAELILHSIYMMLLRIMPFSAVLKFF